MTHAEFADMLLKVGMGWFGWSRRKTIRKPIVDLEIHFEGRLEMLGFMAGGGLPGYGGAEAAEARNMPPITVDIFDSIFG